MKIYVTKYALTDGITEREAEVKGDMAMWRGKHLYAYARKGEWFPTVEEAIADAEKRRLSKIASHEKSIERLRKLTFSEDGVVKP